MNKCLAHFFVHFVKAKHVLFTKQVKKSSITCSMTKMERRARKNQKQRILNSPRNSISFSKTDEASSNKNRQLKYPTTILILKYIYSAHFCLCCVHTYVGSKLMANWTRGPTDAPFKTADAIKSATLFCCTHCKTNTYQLGLREINQTTDAQNHIQIN